MGAGEESLRSSPARVVSQLRKAPLGDDTQGFGSQDAALETVPPSSAQSAVVSCSHSGGPGWRSPSSSPSPSPPSPSCSATQQVTIPGGVGAHGFGSQLPALMLTPPAALHSAALSSSHSGPSSSGRQQRMSGAGVAVEQGVGKHVPVPMFVPPFAVHYGSPPSLARGPRGRDVKGRGGVYVSGSFGVNRVVIGHSAATVQVLRDRGRSSRELTPCRGGASSARCASGGGGGAGTRGCRRAAGRGSGGSRRAAACCTRCGAPHTSSGSSPPGTRRTSGRARRRRQHGARRHCAASGACRRCSASCAGRAAWPRRRVLRGKASSFFIIMPAEQGPCQRHSYC